jgi:parvulin-like peptidyl-prolyl isomerase
MASIGKPTKPEKPRTELQKRFKTNPLLFVGTVVVLIIVVVAFVLVPAIVPEAGGLGFDATFGYYGKAPIRYAANNYFYRTQEYYRNMYSGITGFERYIWRQAFDEAAVHTAFIEEARLSGYVPPDEMVDKVVAQYPVFQENGRFSAVLYNTLDNTTKSRYWQDAQEGLITLRYVEDVSSALISSQSKTFLADMAARQRAFNVTAFSVNDYPAEEVTAYIEANADLFKTVHLSQITVTSSERDAQRVLDQIQSGAATFEDSARSQSADSNADRGGDMGSKMVYELESDIPDMTARSAVLALVPGAVSEVVQVPAGWAFFRVEEAVREADGADTATIDKVRTYLLGFQRGIVEDYYLAKAEAFNAEVESMGFENACAEMGLTSSKVGPLPINYGDTNAFATVSSYGVDALNGAAVNENFWKTAFSTTVGVPSRPIVLGDNIVVLLPTEEITLDDDGRAVIENNYAGFINDQGSINNAISQVLMKDKKFKDRFDEVFSKLYREE